MKYIFAAMPVLIASLMLVSDGRGATAATAQRIVTLGDSITDGYTFQLLIRQALQEAGKPVPVIINAGVGGDTAEQMFARIDDDVLRYNPDLVILNGGVNDARKKSPEEFHADIARILDRLRDAKIPVLMSTIITVAPNEAKLQHDKLDPMNDALRELAKERGLPIARVSEIMAKATDDNALHEPDGIHLNLAGYRLFSRAMLDALGYSDVPVPAKLKIAPLPGVIENWHFKSAASSKPLTETEARALVVDDSWKPYLLPDTQPVPHWWQDSMRQWGVAMGMSKTINGTEKDGAFVGISIVHSDADKTIWVNTGAHVRTVWLNGEKLPTRPETPYHGWHPGRDRLKTRLRKGDNTFIIETGKWFFVSLTEDDRW